MDRIREIYIVLRLGMTSRVNAQQISFDLQFHLSPRTILGHALKYQNIQWLIDASVGQIEMTTHLAIDARGFDLNLRLKGLQFIGHIFAI